MRIFNKAKWIWKRNVSSIDDYVSFVDNFSCSKKSAKLLISCDSIYAVYLNDKLISTMQCSDYPYAKFYDEIILDDLKENNSLRIDVWHLGVVTQNYYPDKAGLIFELIDSDAKPIIYSSKKTPSRVMEEFKNGLNKRITRQLGLSFAYDCNVNIQKFDDSIEIRKKRNFVKRDINKINILCNPNCKLIKLKKSVLVDMGKEIVGFPTMKFVSKRKQNILIKFGEHIVDGGVRQIIGDRDFSFEIVAKKGINEFSNPLRRLAGRYLEIVPEEDIEIEYAALKPVQYSHEIIKKEIDDKLIDDIYKTCIYTLECCMHEHYEDCPWREQALYTLDSRNQMLCGYYVFKGFEYQKHNILLIAKDPMPLGLLSLCYPEKNDNFAIPFFSLVYILQVYEYVVHTNDIKILNSVKKTIEKIIKFFRKRIDDNGLIEYLPKPFWNFYEWTDGSDNMDVFDENSVVQKDRYDLILNAMYCYAIEIYNKLFNKNIDVDSTKKSIVKYFYVEKDHLFKSNNLDSRYTQFGNALALLIGLGDKNTVEKVKNCESLIEASLPVRGFVYDCLLMNDKSNLDFIISDIKVRYKRMLDQDATTFFETEDGEKAFDKAGSLCHGWSALPVYYINLKY